MPWCPENGRGTCTTSLDSEPPQEGPENWCRAKIVKKCWNLFDTFWTIFDSFFALREKCRKVSKRFLTLFDDFWRFLTWPLSAGPFCGPLMDIHATGHVFNFSSRETVFGIAFRSQIAQMPLCSRLTWFSFWIKIQPRAHYCRARNYYVIISERSLSCNFWLWIIRTGANPVILGVPLSAGCHRSLSVDTTELR